MNNSQIGNYFLNSEGGSSYSRNLGIHMTIPSHPPLPPPLPTFGEKNAHMNAIKLIVDCAQLSWELSRKVLKIKYLKHKVTDNLFLTISCQIH